MRIRSTSGRTGERGAELALTGPASGAYSVRWDDGSDGFVRDGNYEVIDKPQPEEPKTPRMTSHDYAELERLCRKASWDEKENHNNQNNFDILQGVEVFASRRR